MYITNFEISYVNRIADSLEQVLLFGRVKRVSRKRASERPSREAPHSRVLARLALLEQIGELARRLNIGYREGWGVGDWREGPWSKGWTFASSLQFGRNLFCTLNHDKYTFLTTGLLYKSTKSGQNVQLKQVEKCCEPFLYGFFVNVPDVWKWLTSPSNTVVKNAGCNILMYGVI